VTPAPTALRKRVKRGLKRRESRRRGKWAGEEQKRGNDKKIPKDRNDKKAGHTTRADRKGKTRSSEGGPREARTPQNIAGSRKTTTRK